MKVDWSTQKPRGTPLSRPRWPFWGPLAAILDFEVLIERMIESKNLICKNLSESPRGLSILGPLAAILNCAGGAGLQAVSERPLRR